MDFDLFWIRLLPIVAKIVYHFIPVFDLAIDQHLGPTWKSFHWWEGRPLLSLHCCALFLSILRTVSRSIDGAHVQHLLFNCCCISCCWFLLIAALLCYLITITAAFFLFFQLGGCIFPVFFADHPYMLVTLLLLAVVASSLPFVALFYW